MRKGKGVGGFGKKWVIGKKPTVQTKDKREYLEEYLMLGGGDGGSGKQHKNDRIEWRRREDAILELIKATTATTKGCVERGRETNPNLRGGCFWGEGDIICSLTQNPKQKKEGFSVIDIRNEVGPLKGVALGGKN